MLFTGFIFGHVLIVTSRCYGHCYVKKRMPLCNFLNFHTHLEKNSVRSFQNVSDKSSRVLILVFPKHWIFLAHRHILGYRTPLQLSWGLLYGNLWRHRVLRYPNLYNNPSYSRILIGSRLSGELTAPLISKYCCFVAGKREDQKIQSEFIFMCLDQNK